jgi:hypothetical protein
MVSITKQQNQIHAKRQHGPYYYAQTMKEREQTSTMQECIISFLFVCEMVLVEFQL